MLDRSAVALLTTGALVLLPACVSSVQHQRALAEVRQTERERSKRFAQLAEETEERLLKTVESLNEAEQRQADLELALARENQQVESERMLVEQLRGELERASGHLRHFADEARRLGDSEQHVERLKRKLDGVVQLSDLLLEHGDRRKPVPATLAATPEGDVVVSLRSSAVFMPGTPKLTEDASKLLEALASMTARDPELRVELVDGEVKLAEARGEVVRDALAAHGASEAYVTVVPLGEGARDSYRVRISQHPRGDDGRERGARTPSEQNPGDDPKS